MAGAAAGCPIGAAPHAIGCAYGDRGRCVSGGNVAGAAVDLRRLGYLVALARERHFGRAATMLGITQPSLSQQVARLESEVGARLVDRDVRPVALTAAGDALVAGAGPALAHIEDAVAEARRRAGVGRPFRLALPRREYARHPPLARLIAGTRARLPGSRIELVAMLTAEAAVAVRDRAVDAAVVYAPVDGDGIDLRPLFPDAPVVIMPPGHRLAGRPGVSLSDLADEVIVTWSPQVMAAHDLVVSACRREGFAPRVAEAPAEPGALAGMVADGVGVALVSGMWAASGAAPDLCASPLVHPRIVLSVALIWRADRDDDPVRAVLAASRDAAAA